jgi:hypothetical protein
MVEHLWCSLPYNPSLKRTYGSLIIPPFWNLRFLLFTKEDEGLKEKGKRKDSKKKERGRTQRKRKEEGLKEKGKRKDSKKKERGRTQRKRKEEGSKGNLRFPLLFVIVSFPCYVALGTNIQIFHIVVVVTEIYNIAVTFAVSIRTFHVGLSGQGGIIFCITIDNVITSLFSTLKLGFQNGYATAS